VTELGPPWVGLWGRVQGGSKRSMHARPRGHVQAACAPKDRGITKAYVAAPNNVISFRRAWQCRCARGPFWWVMVGWWCAPCLSVMCPLAPHKGHQNLPRQAWLQGIWPNTCVEPERGAGRGPGDSLWAGWGGKGVSAPKNSKNGPRYFSGTGGPAPPPPAWK
jgi:hypothetical protein